MKKTGWKRLGAVMLTLVMLLSAIPSAAFAVDTTATAEEERAAQTYSIKVTTEHGFVQAKIHHPDGTEQAVRQAEPGQTIHLHFTENKMPDRTAFLRWVDDNGNLTDLQNADSHYECTFTMPEGNVNIHAELVQNCPTLTVENGVVMVRNGDYRYWPLSNPAVAPNRTVYLHLYDDKVPAGKEFQEWYVKSGEAVLSNPTARHGCKLVMPNGDVEIGVKYKDNVHSIQVTASEGEADASIRQSDGMQHVVECAAPGETVQLSFHDRNMTPGTAFVKWVDDNGNLTDLQNSDNYYNCTFTMPDGEVSIHAELAQNSPTITVENGTMLVEEEGKLYQLQHSSVAPNRTVHLHYDDSKTPEGKVFREWYVKSGDAVLKNPIYDGACSFVVPNSDVEIGVKYDEKPVETTYPIQLITEEGWVEARIQRPNGTEQIVKSAAPGETVHLAFMNAGMTPGTAFVKWVDDNGNLTDMKDADSYYGCTFTMPDGAVRIHAELAQNCPTITVENGQLEERSALGGYLLDTSTLCPNRTMYLFYDQSQTPAGKEFVEWYVKSGNAVLSDPTDRYDCSFVVPDGDVEIGVKYREGVYPIRITSDEGRFVACVQHPDGSETAVRNAQVGETVRLSFYDRDMTPGTAFVKWVDDNGNLTDLQNADSYHGCTFTMPEGEVRIHAELAQNCPTITVENGCLRVNTKDGTVPLSHSSVAPGKTVYVGYDSAQAPEGEEFREWYVKSGNVVLNNPTVINGCSFVVPDGDVKIGVRYQSDEVPAPAGWQSDENGWWYNDDNGSRLTGWQQLGGFWFYFAEDGYMLTGWQAIGGNWFYLDGNGHMLTGWQQIGGNWFYLNGLGHMMTGWQAIDGNWYYFNSLGHMLTGWQWIDGKCYYFYSSGYMATSTWIGGSYVDASGAWVQNPVATGWQSNSVGWWYNDENGNYVTGWQQIGSFWFYFSGNGYMQTGWQIINGTWYYLDGNGHLLTGWQAIGGAWYYFDGNGHMMTGWQWIDGNCYYFYSSGYMATNTWIGGSYVNGSGVWVQ